MVALCRASGFKISCAPDGLPPRMLLIKSLISHGIDFTKGSTEKSEQVFLEEAVYVIHVIFLLRSALIHRVLFFFR